MIIKNLYLLQKLFYHHEYRLPNFLSAIRRSHFLQYPVAGLCVVHLPCGLPNKDPCTQDRCQGQFRKGTLSNLKRTDHPWPCHREKKFQRAYNPAGIIFCERNGDETGGIAITDNDRTHLNALAFDYQNADTVGIFAQEIKVGNYFREGLVINDKDLSGRHGQNINRINPDHRKRERIAGDQGSPGKASIILKLDSLGNPSIEKLDSTGIAIWRNSRDALTSCSVTGALSKVAGRSVGNSMRQPKPEARLITKNIPPPFGTSFR